MKELQCDCDAIHSETVKMVTSLMPSDREFSLLETFFKVFADKTRSKILWALDVSELCVCDLAALLNMSKSAISHQLNKLKLNRLVDSRRDGKVVFYSLIDSHIKMIIESGREHVNE
ncbi:MAG: metalloregulator ArsR/SmtB family transcription factor [Christensenellaceae bacterium]|jgi:ArsR family transcriptional regulator|nr:metalloregulator ArsR/SmtB family transcription factor [Christensenellaceae bacterium]